MCRLCYAGPEDLSHFLSTCNALRPYYERLSSILDNIIPSCVIHPFLHVHPLYYKLFKVPIPSNLLHTLQNTSRKFLAYITLFRRSIPWRPWYLSRGPVMSANMPVIISKVTPGLPVIEEKDTFQVKIVAIYIKCWYCTFQICGSTSLAHTIIEMTIFYERSIKCEHLKFFISDFYHWTP